MASVEELSLVLGDGATIACTVFAPEAGATDEPLPVLFLLPGGGMSRRYFDIRLDGGGEYSQARWLAAQGILVIAADPLGTGDSSLGAAGDPPTRQAVERSTAEAVGLLLERLRSGRLVAGFPAPRDCLAIGAGHSVGGHLIVGMQAAHAVFDAIAPMGASMTWTRLKLREGEHYPYRAQDNNAFLATAGFRVDWRNNDHWPDVAQSVIEQDHARTPKAPWRTTNLPWFAGELTEPFASARQAANVRVPVLLIYGQQDVTVEPLEDAATFRAAPSVSLFVVPGMGHSHNLANTRLLAWKRLQLFTREVVEMRRLGPCTPAGG